MTFKKIFLATCWVSVSLLSQAQDFHFSQFYNSPLTLNPALTGKIKEDFRVGLIHRSQWKAVNSAYTTSSMFADINFIKNPIGLDMWGVGLVALNDEIGDGMFTAQTVGLSLSGMKTLDELKRHKLSFGIQPSFVTKGLNTNNFTFDNQINSSYQVDRNISSGEQLNANKYSYVNFNAGLFWDFVLSKKIDLFTGYSASNVLRPKESPLLGTKGRVPVRHALNPGLVYTINNKWSVTPNMLIAYQAKAMDVNLGLYGAYTFNPETPKPTTAFLGVWYRAKDAAIAMAGLKWGHYQVAFSYDYTVSNLREVKNAKAYVPDKATVGAWEISFIYVGFLKRAIPSETTIPCKFF